MTTSKLAVSRHNRRLVDHFISFGARISNVYLTSQLFIDPGKLLPLSRFMPKPASKGPKKKGPPGGVGGRGGFGGRGGGGGRGGFGRGAGGGRGEFDQHARSQRMN